MNSTLVVSTNGSEYTHRVHLIICLGGIPTWMTKQFLDCIWNLSERSLRLRDLSNTLLKSKSLNLRIFQIFSPSKRLSKIIIEFNTFISEDFNDLRKRMKFFGQLLLRNVANAVSNFGKSLFGQSWFTPTFRTIIPTTHVWSACYRLTRNVECAKTTNAIFRVDWPKESVDINSTLAVSTNGSEYIHFVQLITWLGGIPTQMTKQFLDCIWNPSEQSLRLRDLSNTLLKSKSLNLRIFQIFSPSERLSKIIIEFNTFIAGIWEPFKYRLSSDFLCAFRGVM
jgi:hypothetical protein